MALAGTKEQHRGKTRLMAAELRHDVKITARNIAEGDCIRAMKRIILLSRNNGMFLAERSWVSRKHGGVDRQLDKLREKFNKVCVIGIRHKVR